MQISPIITDMILHAILYKYEVLASCFNYYFSPAFTDMVMHAIGG